MPGSGPESTVTCIACGEELARSDAREYDKLGDRWDREGKTFEYLCKPCFGDIVKQPREGLERALEDARAGTVSDAEFLEQFLRLDRDTDIEGEPE